MPKITVNEFKGYSSAKSLLETPIDFLRQANNCLIINGQIRKRRKFSSYAFTDSNDILGMIELDYTRIAAVARRYLFYKNNDGVSTSLWRVAYGSTLQNGPTTVTTAGNANRPHFKFANNIILYCADGDEVHKFFISTGPTNNFEEIGIPAGTAPVVSAQAGAGGTLNGATGYTYAWVEDNDYQEIEGNIFPWDGAVTSVNLTAGVNYGRIVIPASPHTRINKARIYRMNPGGTIGYQIAEVTVTTAGTTTYNDTPTATQNTLLPAPIDENGQFGSTCKILEWHKQRMFYAQYTQSGTNRFSNRLFWSEILKPESVKSVSYVEVGDENDEFISLITLPQFLLIIKQRSIWILEGSSPADFRLQQINNYGSLAPEGTLYYRNAIYLINEEGIFKTNGFDEPLNLSDQIKEDWDLINADSDFVLEYSFVVVEPVTGYIWFCFNTTSGVNSFTVFIFNPKIGLFVGKIDDFVCRCFTHLEEYNDKARLAYYDVSSNNVKAYDIFPSSGLTDETELDNLLFTTGAFVEEMSGQNKLYRLVKFIVSSELDETVELWVVRSTEGSGSEDLITNSLVLGANSETKKGIGRSAHSGLGIQLSGDNLSFASNKYWAIAGMEIEYEKIGNW